MIRYLSLAVCGFALMAYVGTVSAVEVGEQAPSFSAIDCKDESKEITLKNSKGENATVICFTCNQCPVAVAYEDRFIEFNKEYKDQGVSFVAINVNYTEDRDAMKLRAEEKGFNFPYAYDASGESAKAYGAKVTPHLFVLDKNGTVVYMGAFDNSMQSPTKSYVEDAVDAVLAGKTPPETSTRAVGCGIKIKR